MLIAYPIPAFYRQIDEPADALTGALWFNTSTNILKVLNSSSEWVNVAEEQDLILKLIGNNALNILDLTAQANLTAGINANFERDIYTDSDGYLNTIDAGNTTASFDTNLYKNNLTEPLTYTKSYNTFKSSTTIDFTAKTDNIYLSHFELTTTTSSSFTIAVVQNSVTLASKSLSGSSTLEFDFTEGDFSSLIQAGDFQVTITSDASYYADHEQQTYDGTLYSMSSSYVPNNNTDGIIFTGINQNTCVQTNAQTIEAGFTKFMIVANEETSGTGSVTYDISFDNGTNYQEDLESFTEYNISDAGTSLILKQKLNAGASSGIASAYNWGVLLW